jgi:hypothetical protein
MISDTNFDYTLNLADQIYVYNGKELMSALLDKDLHHIDTFTLTSLPGWTTSQYCETAFGDVATLLQLVLENCPNITKFTISKVSLDNGQEFFSSLEQHRPNLIRTLELEHLELSRNDIQAVGPCFGGGKDRRLKWYMNRFDEVDYENAIEPYFEHVTFENDDGWHPGHEIHGDGQLVQAKNARAYY